MSAETPLLGVVGASVRYGAVEAVRNVDLAVQAGGTVAVIGPNGAGKTSLVSVIAGLVPLAAGHIAFEGRPMARLPLEDVIGRGIALVPEGRHIFATLTVEENLLLGATIRNDAPGVRRDIDRFYDAFPILGRRRTQPAGQLSGGEQQQLAIARALLSRPKLVMLDEPSLGLAPTIIDQVYALIRDMRDRGVAVLLIEQNAERAFSVADRVHVMSGGALSLMGTPEELRRNPNFDAAYFGIGMS